MLDRAAWGGCGISILQLFKPRTSPGAFLQRTDPSRVLAMDAALRGTLGTSLGRQWAVPRQGRGGRSPKAMGVGCQLGELLPCQLPPSLGCTAHQPLPTGRCLLLLVPGASAQTGLFQQEVQCDLTYFLNYFFFSSGLFMKLEQSFIYDFFPHKSINSFSHKHALRADRSGHVDNND